jgi:RNA-directed DNA polymerase
MAETSSSTTVSTKLEQIAKLAREMPQAALTTLAHHIDLDWLREAYRHTRKDGATGIDRQTAEEYTSNLDDNLRHAF